MTLKLYTSPFARRMHGLVGQAYKVLWLQETRNRDVFVNGLPVNTDAAANEFPVSPLLRSGFKQPGKPSNGDRNHSAIHENHR